MTLYKNIKHTKRSKGRSRKYYYGTIKLLFISFFLSFFLACDSFVEVDFPENQIAAEFVFENAETANAALANIYAQMRDGGLVSGFNGISQRIGSYSDELDGISNLPDLIEFSQNNLLATNGTVASWWNSTYNLIYATNAVIEGIENSSSLTTEDQNRFKGEALFIRAYLHSLLVELFGDIPYIIATDFVTNTTVARMPVNEVYDNIISDLISAESLLEGDVTGERVRSYKAVANALLSRLYLYTEQWELAKETADKVINAFMLEPDLSKVFLKNSSGSIWQFKPRNEGENTKEGQAFILVTAPPVGLLTLSSSIVNTFEPGDLRQTLWVGSITDGTDTWYYPFKYKERDITSTSLEYSVLFRLAEQYLIRAEARALLGDITGAQSDLNVIRTRAGLTNTAATTQNGLIDAILQERQLELFTEQGHRWFDLKRTGSADAILSPLKPGWNSTDILLPIPEAELLINPNLSPQNDGY